jgi:hypothetical protein
MRFIVFLLLFVEYLRLKQRERNEVTEPLLPEYAAPASEQG